MKKKKSKVVPYIGTWIETCKLQKENCLRKVVPYIGTWIETAVLEKAMKPEVESYLI